MDRIVECGAVRVRCDIIEGIQPLHIGTVEDFHARDTGGVLSAGEAAAAAVAVADHGLGAASVPRHGAEVQGGGGGECRAVVVNDDRGVLCAADGHALNVRDLFQAECLRAGVCTGKEGNRAAFDKAGAVSFGNDHALDARFRDGHGNVVVITRAALQNAAVLQIEVAQLPHIQQPFGIAVVPQSLVCVAGAGLGQSRGRGGVITDRFPRAGGQIAVFVEASAESRVPCHGALAVVRRDVARIGPIAAALGGAPALVIIACVLPLTEPQSEGECIDRRGVAPNVETVLPVNGQHIHGAVCEGGRICADIPCHGVLLRPVLAAVRGVGGQSRRREPREVVHLCHFGGGADLRLCPAQRIGLILPRDGQHGEPAAEASILGVGAVVADRPPHRKDVRGVGAVQHGGKNGVGLCVAVRRAAQRLMDPAQVFVHRVELLRVRENGFEIAHCLMSFPSASIQCGRFPRKRPSCAFCWCRPCPQG